MKPAISQVSTLNTPIEKELEDYGAAHCDHVELWMTKVEAYLKNHSIADFRSLLKKNGLEATVASYHGGLLISQGESRRLAWDHFDQRLALCRELGVETFVVAGDVAGPLNEQDLGRVRVSLVDAANRAQQHSVRIAFEFHANAIFPNNLQTATAMIAEIGHPSLGICLDVFEYYLGPSKPEDLERINTKNLFHVQLSDIADVPREFAGDSDRILPGDGDIRLGPIVDRLREIGYQGCVSLETMNPQIWQISALHVAEVGITAIRKVLGLASS